MSAVPPPFQEASRCDVCHCSFNTFRRRHHCRRCGKTLCHEHSSYYMALPQFGIYSDVRVCADCLNGSSRSEKDDKQTSADSSSPVNALSMTSDASTSIDLSKLKLGKDAPASGPTTSLSECKCGMPLCICVVPTPEPTPPKIQSSTISSTPSNTRVKKTGTSQQPAESSSRKPASSSSINSSSFFSVGQASNGNLDKGLTNYDASGEGLREAIKNRDATAVKELLSKGVDANYCDKQGMTLLHLDILVNEDAISRPSNLPVNKLRSHETPSTPQDYKWERIDQAALFNQTEIAFILIDHGANMKSRNAQGETPVDCAPTMLQNKMRQKMEELSSVAQA